MDKKKFNSSYELRDAIAEAYNLQKGEITTGINGYPSHLRGCVLLCDTGMTFEQMEAIAKEYGVEIVELRRKDGWRFWEERGTAFELFNYQDFLTTHNDNVVDYPNYKSYAEELRDRAKDYREYENNEPMAAKYEAAADAIENKEMAEDTFLWHEGGEMLSCEEEKIHVDGFWYDTWSYALALDCMIV